LWFFTFRKEAWILQEDEKEEKEKGMGRKKESIYLFVRIEDEGIKNREEGRDV